MSVIGYGDKKFQDIHKSLQWKGNNLAWCFEYPEGWNNFDGLKSHITRLVQDLQRGNAATYNRQYRENCTIDLADLTKGAMYKNDIELLKSLKGLRYNLIDNAGNETNLLGSYKTLDKIIDGLSSEIISSLPQWEAAQTW